MNNTLPKAIGITGGIGSGKSTIARILQSMGYPIYYADKRAKILMNSDESLVQDIISLFGNEVYKNQELNRPYLANIVFNDSVKLQELNNLVHPAVATDFKKWTSSQTTNFVFKEAAILFEIGSHKELDYNILVTAPVEERIKRTMARDKTTREAVLDRMKNQWADQQKIPLADFIIDNGGCVLVIPQVLEIINSLKKKVDNFIIQ